MISFHHGGPETVLNDDKRVQLLAVNDVTITKSAAEAGESSCSTADKPNNENHELIAGWSLLI